MQKSDSIAALAKALAAFQGEVKDPTKDGKANYGKYVQLDGLLDAIRPVLSKHGLSVLQMPGGDGQQITITTILMHESGEWMESEPFTLKATKIDPQGAGSAVTYGRRYSLSAILGVAWDADDDGAAASKPLGDAKASVQVNTSKQQQKPAQQQTGPQPLASKAQLNQAAALAQKMGYDIPGLIKLCTERYKKNDKQLTAADADDLIKYLMEMGATA